MQDFIKSKIASTEDAAITSAVGISLNNFLVIILTLDLEKGHHTLRLKVWDVFNNSSEKTIDFYVTDAEEFTLSDLFNYPNPFQDNTKFYFQHNRAGELLDIELQIFDLSGRIVATIKDNMYDDGYRIGPINWDGTTNSGEKLGAGIYVYRFNVKAEDGNSQTKAEKLIILR